MTEPLPPVSPDEQYFDLLGPGAVRGVAWEDEDVDFWLALEDRFKELNERAWREKPMSWWRSWMAGAPTTGLLAWGGRRVDNVCSSL